MEAFPLRAVAHGERLTLTEHLGELRARLVLSVAVLAVLFAGCLWQSRSLLHVLNVPLGQLRTSPAADAAHGALPRALARSATAFTRLAHASSLAPADQRAALDAARSLTSAGQSLSRRGARAPITLGLGEPFSTSVTIAFAFALLLGLPFLLIQAWAFISPAIAPAERRAVRPLLLCAPVLFATGVAFAYLLVLPPAVRFLQGFNHGAFDVLVQARAYYRFELTTMLALGAMFEIPVVLLALGRVGVLSSAALRRHRRHAIVGLSVLGALLPGTDPVTTVLEALPLFGLYEATIVLLRVSERRRSGRLAA
ncbi:MAG TPA: twin-arginine translocase subunit TatC [Gemmatimonadales bacterium]|nr:twin-arginine translocase subunit TatC [Gemmatimonadales bacterium]